MSIASLALGFAAAKLLGKKKDMKKDVCVDCGKLGMGKLNDDDLCKDCAKDDAKKPAALKAWMKENDE